MLEFEDLNWEIKFALTPKTVGNDADGREVTVWLKRYKAAKLSQAQIQTLLAVEYPNPAHINRCLEVRSAEIRSPLEHDHPNESFVYKVVYEQIIPAYP